MPEHKQGRYRQPAEGTVFAVPIRGKWVVGLVARRRGHILLAHFFPRLWARVPTLPDIGRLHPKDAFFISVVGALHLKDGRWKVIGGYEPWLREEWRVKELLRDSLPRVKTLVELDDDNPSIEKSERLVPRGVDTSRMVTQADLLGAGACEYYLESRLGLAPPVLPMETLLTDPAPSRRGSGRARRKDPDRG